MPKPRVHLIGPPLDVSLDARGKGGKARFVRSGCQPNAVLRPVLCDGKRESGSASDPDNIYRRTSSGEQADSSSHSAYPPPPQDTPDSLSFAIFALRDLKVDEEIVLGWEWDDANVVHLLPALLQDKDIFPPAQLAAYKLQMANILRALGATFTSCACGDRAQGCVMRKMKEFVDEVDDWDPEHELQRERELRNVNSGIEPSEEFKHFRAMQDGQGSVNIEMIKPFSTSETFSNHLSPSHPTKSHHQPPSTTGSTAAPSMTVPFDSSLSSTIPGNLQIRPQTSDFFNSSSMYARPLSPSLIQKEQLEQEVELQTQSFAHPTFRRLNKHSTASSSQIPSTSSTVDLGPLIGVPRGFRTREKVEGSGGLGGVEMDTDDSENRGDSVGVGQDVHTKAYVRLGPQDEKQRNFPALHPNLDADSSIFSIRRRWSYWRRARSHDRRSIYHNVPCNANNFNYTRSCGLFTFNHISSFDVCKPIPAFTRPRIIKFYILFVSLPRSSTPQSQVYQLVGRFFSGFSTSAEITYAACTVQIPVTSSSYLSY
ncbi:cell-adhesion partial [Lentinula edodes]|uniref:Cell-adhesion partial n=1 Tax=Lentinula edodes TaxID=5353 RepID=A0A1Q3ERX7_LENED|nr:cell-adhesion partial [Lentinula edodes]